MPYYIFTVNGVIVGEGYHIAGHLTTRRSRYADLADRFGHVYSYHIT
jgi:hypothetical protein